MTANETKWEERLADEPNLTPSMIEDATFSRSIQLGTKKITDRIKLYKHILGQTQYELVSDQTLGKGGFSCVYKIRNKVNDDFFALKVMKLRDTEDPNGQNKFRIFKEEVFALKKIKHKNIIEIIDHFIIEEIHVSFMILEFATEGDLNKRLRDYNYREKKLTETETQTYFAQICNAINCVHSNRIAHRDLKLDNILITQVNGKEVVKVTDFGCARVVVKDEEGVVLVENAAGTVTYMAPEALKVYICQNKEQPELLKRPVLKYNPMRADIWSMGVCLYRMLFFEFPFEYDKYNKVDSISTMIKEMKRGLQIHPELITEWSKDCTNLLRDLLEYHKDKRLTIDLVMKHPWVKASPESDSYQT